MAGPAEIAVLFDQLRGTKQEDRYGAIKALSEAGARQRGALAVRGTALQIAAQHVSEGDVEPLLNALEDDAWETRQQAMLAIGEFCGEGAIDALARLARTDREWRVREAVAETLARIGGDTAVELLQEIARTDPHPQPARRACRGLADLASAAWPRAFSSPVRGAVRTRGAVRVRGMSPSQRLEPAAERILRVLDDIRTSHRDSAVRAAAEDALAELDR